MSKKPAWYSGESYPEYVRIDQLQRVVTDLCERIAALEATVKALRAGDEDLTSPPEPLLSPPARPSPADPSPEPTHPDGPIYGKFRVERTDGRSAPGEKHDGCEYFVLDMTHDPFAWRALWTYAEACEREYPTLAADLRSMANRSAMKIGARARAARKAAEENDGTETD